MRSRGAYRMPSCARPRISLRRFPRPSLWLTRIPSEWKEPVRSLPGNRCNFCHQSDFAGHSNVPRLAGQREDYLLKTLRSYKDNSRYGYEAQMSEVLYPLRDEDFVELAYFLARLK